MLRLWLYHRHQICRIVVKRRKNKNILHTQYTHTHALRVWYCRTLCIRRLLLSLYLSKIHTNAISRMHIVLYTTTTDGSRVDFFVRCAKVHVYLRLVVMFGGGGGDCCSTYTLWNNGNIIMADSSGSRQYCNHMLFRVVHKECYTSQHPRKYCFLEGYLASGEK